MYPIRFFFLGVGILVGAYGFFVDPLVAHAEATCQAWAKQIGQQSGKEAKYSCKDACSETEFIEYSDDCTSKNQKCCVQDPNDDSKGGAKKAGDGGLGGPTSSAPLVNVPPPPDGLRLKLPACVQDGNCKLTDLVETGASFANLLTQLSAALFFATFIYGGAMYLLSFGEKGRVDKGRKAMVGATIGMTIVILAWTAVNFIINTLLGNT